MIAYPFRLLQCCLVTDGGGALILVSAERARDFPQKPVYLLGTGESVEGAPADLRPRRPRRCAARRGRPFHRRTQHPPGENLKLPLNTNGGGLSYMHSGMYALQESVRQTRGTGPRANPRRPDLGLPRRRRHVRRLRHDHHVE